MRYRKRPLVVKAVQWRGDNFEEVQRLAGNKATRQGDLLTIKTLEGVMIVPAGAWVVQGVKGEIYSVADDIFQKTYEVVK